MGIFSSFFSMKRELAMDLGTANTIIIADGEIAVNEPSVVALDPSSDKPSPSANAPNSCMKRRAKRSA